MCHFISGCFPVVAAGRRSLTCATLPPNEPQHDFGKRLTAALAYEFLAPAAAVVPPPALIAGFALRRLRDDPRDRSDAHRDRAIPDDGRRPAGDRATLAGRPPRPARIRGFHIVLRAVAAVGAGPLRRGRAAARLLREGVRLTTNRTNSDVVVEVRTVVLGIDRIEYLLGLSVH